jgi:hypothetical protein
MAVSFASLSVDDISKVCPDALLAVRAPRAYGRRALSQERAVSVSANSPVETGEFV